MIQKISLHVIKNEGFVKNLTFILFILVNRKQFKNVISRKTN